MAREATKKHSAAVPVNRDAFMADLEAGLAASEPQHAPLAIAVIDIDLFGALNEAHGRAAGDAVIGLLRAALESAFHGAGEVYRYGGDALSVLWRGLNKESAFLAVEQFRAGFSGPQKVSASGGPRAIEVTVSAGVAAYPDDGARAQDLINKAYEALYRAKVSGRNQVCLAREDRMVTKTSYYTQGQLMGLRRLAERHGIKDAELLREALNDLLLKHNA